MLPPLTNWVVAAGLVAWTLFLARRAALHREEGSARVLVLSLALVVISRGLFVADVEPNPDTSTWLAAAATVVQRDDPWWTLLTYSDSRPLTVLPLVLALFVGAPLTYVMAEMVGLLFWLGTIVLCFQILRLQLPASASLLAGWTLALYVGTTGHGDDIAYNSEAFAIFLTTLGTYTALRLVRLAVVPAWAAGVFGLLLGLFPFEKMQTVPAGFVLAGFVLLHLIRRRAWRACAALLAGGVLPALFISGYYATQGQWRSFWDTYFWRYYYYSYSEELSPIAMSIRFRLGRIFRFIFGNGWSAVYLFGLTIVVVGACVAWLRGGPGPLRAETRRNLALGFPLLLATVYAVIQAGNDYHHYLLLLFVPLLHVAVSVLAVSPAPWRDRLIVIGVAAATLQGAGNAWLRLPLAPAFSERADQRIAAQVRAHSTPEESVVVWGYADRFHVLAQRPMGYRYANTFYVYSPLRALKDHDLRHFTQDLERNRPALFVDAMLPGISFLGQLRYQHDHFPAVTAYLNINYAWVGTVDGVRFYRRRNAPSIQPTHDGLAPPAGVP